MLGKPVRRPAKLDRRLVRELRALADPEDPYETTTGTTMCANDFYEGKYVGVKRALPPNPNSGQGRTDGAFCDYTEAEKMTYLTQLQSNGVKNIEMEVVPFAALTHHAGIKAAVVCVTLLDRMKGDQVGVL
jgi:uridine phosphorylase